MNNFTLLIQGLLTTETVEFYIKTYPDVPIILSTWDNCAIDIDEFPDNIKLIRAIDPNVSHNQNFLRQLTSTFNGLNQVKTEYVIKLRGDEFYSNLHKIAELHTKFPDKLIVAPIFFRPWDWYTKQHNYHISDHLMSCKTSILKSIIELSFKEYNPGVHQNPEVVMGKKFMETLYGSTYTKEQFKDSIEIVNLSELKPYKVTANYIKKTFYDNFIPSEHNSISNITEL